MMTKNSVAAVAAVLLGVLLLHVRAAEPPASERNVPTEPVLVRDVYPGLASNSLTYARLSDLPSGVILTTDGLTIGVREVADEMAKAPSEVQPQLKNNAFFMLENIATRKLLVMLGKAKTAPQEKDAPALTEPELIQTYLKAIAAHAEVGEAEISEFYAENKDALGGASLEQVKDQIRPYLAQQKQQQVVNEHVRTLGRRLPIEVSAAWTKEQAVLARDNPVDKARGSGKPSLVDFGSTGCVPCDMLAPILETLKAKYAGKLNVLFVHVGQEQILAARYGIQSIPMQFFYDKDGQEVFRHTGFWPQVEIEKKLAQMGVE